MPKIISSSALRNGYNEVSDWCREHQEPVFVTKNGAGDLAVMDIAMSWKVVPMMRVRASACCARSSGYEVSRSGDRSCS